MVKLHIAVRTCIKEQFLHLHLVVNVDGAYHDVQMHQNHMLTEIFTLPYYTINLRLILIALMASVRNDSLQK